MVEQLNTLEKHVKLKMMASDETYINSHIAKKLNDNQTNFNFNGIKEFSEARKKTNRRSEVESLLKYSVEFEKERNNTSIESTSTKLKRDTILKSTLNDEDYIQEVLDNDVEIISEQKCDERVIDYNFLEEDYESNFITFNPSGSVLAPSPNPYNKLDKIAEANLELTRNPAVKYSLTKVTFNDNITLLETSEDSESDDDSDGNDESTSSVDSKLVSNTNDDPAAQSPENSVKIEENSVELANSITFVVDESSSVESDDGITDNNSDDTNANRSVLLVKVPNTPSKNCADISSESENEDVCVGHVKGKGRTPSYNMSLENRNPDYSGDKTPVDQTSKANTQSEEIISTEKDASIITEKIDEGCISNYHEEYLKISETETGITIKITCPDGTDFSKSHSIVSTNDEIFEDITRTKDNKINSSLSNNSGQISETVHVETKKTVNAAKSAEKLKEPETNNNNNNINNNDNNALKNRMRKRSVAHKKFFIKDISSQSNAQDRRKKIDKKNNMNDSELLAEKIFKSLCHNNRTNESSSQLKNEPAMHEQNSNRNLKQKSSSLRNKSAVLKLHSKSVETLEKRKKSNSGVCFCNHEEKERPKSSVDRRRSEPVAERPVTAPAPMQRRCCALWGQGRLPDYNGLHSEYGLSAEQLQERKREKIERNKARKQMREEKRTEEERKRKENEERFAAWLVKKREQEKIKMIQTHLYYYQPNRLHLKNFCAPTAHLIKIGAYRKKQSRDFGCKNFSVDKFLTNISPQEKRTYKIYLGLSSD